MSEAPFDLAIIGGGIGGYTAALRAARRGMRVLLAEREHLGGVCLNAGCIPTKTMLHDAKLYRDAASGAYGMAFDGLRPDYAKLLARKTSVVTGLRDGLRGVLESAGVHLVAGTARLTAPDTLVVTASEGSQRFASRSVLVASGSRPIRFRVPGADLPGVLDTTAILSRPVLPRQLVIIGASVSGMEFACLFQALGAQVTVLDREFFIREADQQLAKRLQTRLRQSGMVIRIGVEVECIERAGDALRVTYSERGETSGAEGDAVLVAIGRVPESSSLGLAELGAAYNGPTIAVDAQLRTTLPGVYAAGDCIGGMMLAHVAGYESDVALRNILGEPTAADYRVVPACVYTLPEIAGVGLNEAQAKARGIAHRVTRYPLSANGRVQSLGEPEGQIRLLADEAGVLIGAQLYGEGVSELVAECALAIRLGASVRDVAETIHAHPTLSEAVAEAAALHDVPRKALL
ncbi:MAG: dihydrolipoyl dehydrogenase [Chloroflexi bacterium]|nr:dihydrolipoyl dehydrogenase [Chloroflexota bacterium]